MFGQHGTQSGRIGTILRIRNGERGRFVFESGEQGRTILGAHGIRARVLHRAAWVVLLVGCLTPTLCRSIRV